MAHILLIDDEELALFTMSEILEDIGHTVATAGDGVAGLALQNSQEFDLVITDMVMPHKVGTQIISEIRAKNSHLPIVAISGGSRVQNVDALEIAKQCGATSVLNKPFSEEELVEVVTACLGMVDN